MKKQRVVRNSLTVAIIALIVAVIASLVFISAVYCADNGEKTVGEKETALCGAAPESDNERVALDPGDEADAESSDAQEEAGPADPSDAEISEEPERMEAIGPFEIFFATIVIPSAFAAQAFLSILMLIGIPATILIVAIIVVKIIKVAVERKRRKRDERLL